MLGRLHSSCLPSSHPLSSSLDPGRRVPGREARGPGKVSHAPSARLGVLRAFRAAVYRCFSQRQDALFKVVDAAACGGAAGSLPHRSLLAVHRRGHGSVYAALRHGVVNAPQLRLALVRHPLSGGLPAYAVDVSVVACCDAETSPGRAYYHPSRHSAGQPIVAGWAYSWVAQLGTERSSWTAPVDAPRLAPAEQPEAVAIRQVRALAHHLADGPIPLFVFDGLQPGSQSGGCSCRLTTSQGQRRA